MISSAQIRAGRALLNIKQSDLAKAAGISLATLNNIERGIGDPRSSTLQAIEKALSDAGVETDEDGVRESVTLLRYARPNALDTYFGSQRVLECFKPNALISVVRVTAYVRGTGSGADESRRICFLIDGAGRSLLFDQMEFSTHTSPRIAEVAGILFAAALRHRSALFFIDRVTEDTAIQRVDEAIELLHAYPTRVLDHPRQFFSVADSWDEKFAPVAAREGHPMRDLVRLYETHPAEPEPQTTDLFEQSGQES